MAEHPGASVSARRGRPARPRRRLALGVGAALLLAAALAVLVQSAPRRAGSNLALVTSYSIALAPGQGLCQLQEVLPADTARLRLPVHSAGPTGPLAVSLLGPTGPVAGGRLAAGWRPGVIEIPVTRVRTSVPGEVCLSNQGRSAVQFGGSQPDPPYTITSGGRTTSGHLRIDYMRPNSESWLGMLGVLSYRFSLGRSPLTRWWAAAAVVALMLAALVVTARILLRAGEDPR